MATCQNQLLVVHAKDNALLPYKMGKELFEIATTFDIEMVTLIDVGHVALFISDVFI